MAGKDLKDQHVVVTGGAQGIGAAITTTSLEQGGRVSFLDIDTVRAEQLCIRLQDHGDRIRFQRADITNAAEVRAAFAAAVEHHGMAVTGLVNNAGRNSYADAVTMTEKQWDEVFSVDLKAAWLCSREVLPAMIDAQQGSIVNIASVHASMTQRGMFPYAAAKSGLVGLTRSLALEVSASQVRVNAVSPGYTSTPLLEDYFANQAPEGERELVLDKHPMGRIGTTTEIAAVVCFLLSPAASFVQGANWSVDGGFGARFA